MRWSDRDQRMARRRMSPGGKVGIFVAVLALAGILCMIGWTFLSLLASEDGGEAYPVELVAGEEFKPEAVVDFKGTETKAVLDGLTQKVQAQDPTEEWLAAMPDAECDDANLCTSPAPNSASAPAGEGEEGNFLQNLLSRFGIKEASLGTLIATLLGAGVVYLLIDEQS